MKSVDVVVIGAGAAGLACATEHGALQSGIRAARQILD